MEVVGAAVGVTVMLVATPDAVGLMAKARPPGRRVKPDRIAGDDRADGFTLTEFDCGDAGQSRDDTVNLAFSPGRYAHAVVMRTWTGRSFRPKQSFRERGKYWRPAAQGGVRVFGRSDRMAYW